MPESRMAMILGRLRRWQRSSVFGTGLRRAGLVALGKKVYEARVLRTGRHSSDVLGRQIIFHVRSSRELTRADGIAEESFLRRLLSVANRNSVFWDVGANVGVIGLRVACEDPMIQVYAFEPEPQNIASLRQNVLLNGLRNMQVHALALGDRTGTIALQVMGGAGTGTNSILSASDGGGKYVQVDVQDGDSVAARDGIWPTIMKLDIEGAEMLALKGMQLLLQREEFQHLFIEIHPVQLASQGQCEDDVLTLLARYGLHSVWRQARGDEIHHHLTKTYRAEM